VHAAPPGDECRRFLLHDDDFFGSPIWHEKMRPLAVLKKGGNDFGAWRRDVPKLKGDALLLGTEAGIDILLYWDGESYALYWPNEEP
ncbi:MAG: hypothetical protein ACRD2R_06115, partial [Terriglobales bacterium]